MTDTTDDIDTTEAQLLQALEMQEQMNTDYKAFAGKKLEPNAKKAQMFDIVEAIKKVSDPEIMINVYDLGLIYKINQQENGDVFVDMTLTAPTCPVAGILPQQVADSIATLEGIGQVEVKVVWEPVWTIERLSEDANAMLDMF